MEIHWGGKVYRFESAEAARQAGFWLYPMPSSKVMHEYKHGKLHSGSKHGPKVRSRKQAVAIMLSERRKEGKRVARKRSRK